MSQPYPSFVRLRTGRIVAGVSTGLSAHLGVEVKWVRLFFALSCFISGLGVLLYGLLWAFTPLQRSGQQQSARYKNSWPAAFYLVLVAVGLGGALLSVSVISGMGGVFAFIVGVVAVGAIVAWQAYDRGTSTPSNVIALITGVVLVMGGVLAIALRGETAGTAGIVIAVLVRGCQEICV